MSKKIIFILIGLFAIFFLNIAFTLAPQPSFCGLCHSRDNRTWAKSSHQEVRCHSCHQQPGVLGLVSQRIKVARMIGTYLTTLYRRPVTAEVASERCFSCHSSEIERRVIVKRAIRVSHKEFVERYECVLCHNTVAHGDAVPRKQFATMDKCLDCHTMGKASTDCNLCHVVGVKREKRAYRDPWRIIHGKTWRTTHGMGDLKTCAVCHGETKCPRCHQIKELPHPMYWLSLHGKVVKEFPDSCRQCHQKTLCQSCHQIPMPHQVGFLPTHPKIVKEKSKEVCLRCHKEPDCLSCHIRHIHPLSLEKREKILQK